MSKKLALPKKKASLITPFMAAIGFKHFATDAEPEEVMDAIEAMAEERGASTDADEPGKEEPKPEDTKDQDPAIQALTEQVAKLAEVVNSLVKAEQKEVTPESAIDDVIAELEKKGADDNNEEESHTIPVEQLDEEGPVSDPGDRPESAITGDNAYKIAALKAMKPIIAAISDPAERKRASDAAIASIKGKPARNTYAAINKGQKKPAADNAATADPAQLGRDIAKKYNPHYKDRG